MASRIPHFLIWLSAATTVAMTTSCDDDHSLDVVEVVVETYGTVRDATSGEPLDSVRVIARTFIPSENAYHVWDSVLTYGGDYSVDTPQGLPGELVFKKCDHEQLALGPDSAAVRVARARYRLDAELAPLANLSGLWVGHGESLTDIDDGSSEIRLLLTQDGDAVDVDLYIVTIGIRHKVTGAFDGEVLTFSYESPRDGVRKVFTGRRCVDRFDGVHELRLLSGDLLLTDTWWVRREY